MLRHTEIILMKNTIWIVTSLHDLIKSCFPKCPSTHFELSIVAWRAILVLENNVVHDMNKDLLKLPEHPVQYKSIDSATDISEAVHFVLEFLNTLSSPGLLLHNPELERRVPIRNLEPSLVCTSTRSSDQKLLPHVIEATIMLLRKCLIHQMPIISSDLPRPFKWP